VAVRHCDVIRAALAHHLGMSLDHLPRRQVDPASVSTLELAADFAHVRAINEASRDSEFIRASVREV